MEISVQGILAALAGGGGVVAVLLTIIQISNIKINPWSFILNALGQMMTRGVMDEVKELNGGMEQRLHNEILSVRDELVVLVTEKEAINARYRIIRFHGEILNGIHHSKDHFEQILKMIDACETYCKIHEDFITTQCKSSCEHIKEIYAERLRKKDFI